VRAIAYISFGTTRVRTVDYPSGGTEVAAIFNVTNYITGRRWQRGHQ